MKICTDGRIWGQNNKEAGSHLGIITGRRPYVKKIRTKEDIRRQNRRGSNFSFSGRQHSIKTRKQMSKASMGDKNASWEGGISSINKRIRGSIESRLWHESVFARDNWTCQECGKRGGRLHSHHIKSFRQYPELRFAIDNGKTICVQCHKLTNNYARRE